MCTFNSINVLKVHLAIIHPKIQDAQLNEDAQVTFNCHTCDFSAPCTEAVFLTHLRSAHLKVNHTVQCPYNGCNFNTNVYSTFNAHKNREIVTSSVNTEMAQEEHEPPNDTSTLRSPAVKSFMI